MKQILSYNSEYDNLCVAATAMDEKAGDVFRNHVKERAMQLLSVAEDEAEALLNDEVPYIEDRRELSYNADTGAAKIEFDGEFEIMQLADVPGPDCGTQ